MKNSKSWCCCCHDVTALQPWVEIVPWVVGLSYFIVAICVPQIEKNDLYSNCGDAVGDSETQSATVEAFTQAKSLLLAMI